MRFPFISSALPSAPPGSPSARSPPPRRRRCGVCSARVARCAPARGKSSSDCSISFILKERKKKMIALSLGKNKVFTVALRQVKCFYCELAQSRCGVGGGKQEGTGGNEAQGRAVTPLGFYPCLHSALQIHLDSFPPKMSGGSRLGGLPGHRPLPLPLPAARLIDIARVRTRSVPSLGAPNLPWASKLPAPALPGGTLAPTKRKKTTKKGSFPLPTVPFAPRFPLSSAPGQLKATNPLNPTKPQPVY